MQTGLRAGSYIGAGWQHTKQHKQRALAELQCLLMVQMGLAARSGCVGTNRMRADSPQWLSWYKQGGSVYNGINTLAGFVHLARLHFLHTLSSMGWHPAAVVTCNGTSRRACRLAARSGFNGANRGAGCTPLIDATSTITAAAVHKQGEG